MFSELLLHLPPFCFASQCEEDDVPGKKFNGLNEISRTTSQ